MAKKPNLEAARFLAPVGENILVHRETLGMTKADLAGLIGVSVNYIDRLERPQADARFLTLEKIAVSYGVDVAALLDSRTCGNQAKIS